VRYLPHVLRRALVLILVACAAWPATSAWPAERPGAFVVTVHGTQQSVVTRVHRATDALGCLTTRNELDRRTHTFTTRRPGRLEVTPGGRAEAARVALRIQAAGSHVRRISVAGGPPACAVAPQASETSCGPVAVIGVAVVRIPARGTIRISGSPARRGDNARCAPAAAPGAPFLVPSGGAFRARVLSDPKIDRITLRGSSRHTHRLESGARRVTTVRWTVVLSRTD
jgi:hypothetical protein